MIWVGTIDDLYVIGFCIGVYVCLFFIARVIVEFSTRCVERTVGKLRRIVRLWRG